MQSNDREVEVNYCSRSFSVDIDDQTRVGEARRVAAELSRNMSLNETDSGKVALIVTELGTNLLKHAGGGRIIFRALEEGNEIGMEILSIDKGPGMADLEICFRDGFSTSGTPGSGLGAVTRLSSVFDVFSAANAGTVLLSQVWTKSSVKPQEGPTIGAICLPKKGEDFSGDTWNFRGGKKPLIVVVDGLGHGVVAAQAADEAARVFNLEKDSGPLELLKKIHAGLQKTRGAAVAVAQLDGAEQKLIYTGIGNIAGHILQNENSRGLVSHNGTVGHHPVRFQEFTYPWVTGSLLVMHSDGISSRWNLEKYPGLLARHPGVIAAIIYRDFCRNNDDTTVVVIRQS